MIVCELVESIWVKGNFNEAVGSHHFRLHKTALGTISSFSLIFSLSKWTNFSKCLPKYFDFLVRIYCKIK